MSFRDDAVAALLHAIDAMSADEKLGRSSSAPGDNLLSAMKVAGTLILLEDPTPEHALMAVNDLTASLAALPADAMQVGISNKDKYGARGAMKDAVKILSLTIDAAGIDAPRFETCGCCGGLHRAGFSGDCRDDTQRFAPDELDEILGSSRWIEIDPVEDYEETGMSPSFGA